MPWLSRAAHVMDDRQLVVGLGNPGPRYAATRHNAGFLVVDVLADRVGGRFKAHRAPSGRSCDMVETRIAGGPIVSISRFYKVPVEQITIVHDDLDLPFGTLRIKRGGGDGGHNGLRSATSALGSKDYLRVRFGVGRPPGRQDPADYVLREFSVAERKEVPYLVDRAADAVEALLAQGLEAAQNQFHEPQRP